MSVTVHPSLETTLLALRHDLPQSLLITGIKGVGLATIAKDIADKNLHTLLYPANKKEEDDEIGGSIGVEAIRDLYEHTKAKFKNPQVVIIDNADRMTRAAQSAFLKLLEEPNSSMHFILTSHAPQLLLPTIRSRVQHVNFQPITTSQTTEYLTHHNVADTAKIAKLLFIAPGLPAELHRLINDADYFEARSQTMLDAKDLLQASGYDKLVLINRYQTDKLKSLQLLDSAMIITKRMSASKPQPALIKQMERLLDAYSNVLANHNIRLQLMQFVL